MGGCRCSYKTCTNFTRPDRTTHFFHYPVKNKARCDTWIKNACKPQFNNLTIQQLRNKVICEDHFEDHYFPNTAKKRLLKAAIPTLDGPNLAPQNEMNSTTLDNLKIVPANEDGTIFVLDTVNMSSSLNCPKTIESYVYKDGSVVPLQEDSYNTESDIFHDEPMEFDNVVKIDGFNLNLRPVEPNSQCSNPNKNLLVENNSNSECSIEVNENELLPLSITKQVALEKRLKLLPEKITIQKVVEEGSNVPPATTSSGTSVDFKKNQASPPKPTKDIIDSKYISKIKQHSKEIATIKRMLKRNHNRPLPNSKVLNTLKCRLPASLYTILNLALCNTYNFSTDDIEFFNSIYEKSPDVYAMLSEKYKWNFPPVTKILNK